MVNHILPHLEEDEDCASLRFLTTALCFQSSLRERN